MGASVWLNNLLAGLQAAQLALLRLCHALGLTGDSHGQPAWPWARRIAGETLLIDPGLARQLAWSLVAMAFALLALMLALAWRRGRLASFGAGALALILAPWPAPDLVLGPAAPTSFHVSPTRFAVASIARGERVYTRHCAACHGDDGRGEGPLAASLSRWPPTLAGPLLGRRADGELFWHIVAGMRGRDGQPTMPAFGATLGDADVWAVIDYMKALSAGTGARLQGTWPTALALPDMPVQCEGAAPRSLADWRGTQRVRLVAVDSRAALPMEDPRFLTLLVTPDGHAPAEVPQFRAGCVAAASEAWAVMARIAGVSPAALPGTALLSDRQGWLRARGAPGQAAWRESDLLCTSGGPRQSPDPSVDAPVDGLTALLLRMDAEPVRFIKGGFVH
jgi:mono/diheme cytochrome c family protein